MKFIRHFQWENTWLWGSFFVMIVIPWVVATLVLPNVLSDIFAAGYRSVLLAALFGFGWGFGTVTFGLGISRIGLSLGYAIIMGVNTAVGSLLPLLALSPGDLLTPGGRMILVGIAGCILGVGVCGYAGILKGNHSREISGPPDQENVERPPKDSILKGMIICVVSGVLSSFLNLGFSFGQSITAKAREGGAIPSLAGLATWIVIFCGSFPAVLIYCGRLQIKKKTWRNNFGLGAAHDFLLTFVLGLLWFGAIILYGIGASRLGHLGTSVGWAVNLSASLVVANILGFATGEWKEAAKASKRWILGGLALLILSMAVLGYGNSMLGLV
jgi:L-rhamnose-H+ transport protein